VLEDPILTPFAAAGILGTLVIVLGSVAAWLLKQYLNSLERRGDSADRIVEVLEVLTKAVDGMSAGIKERSALTAGLLDAQQRTADSLIAVNRAQVRAEDLQEEMAKDMAKALRGVSDLEHHLTFLRTAIDIAGRP
jgi:biopolymer transport protein ExbB/TolQ